MSSPYLRLLIFLLAFVIPACASSSPAFHMMMCSAYKLNKQSDSIQPWLIPFLIWNQSVVPCQFSLMFPDMHTDFSRGSSSGLVFPSLFRIFHSFFVIHTVKGFGINNKTEIDVFLELCCFIDHPAYVGSLISGSSAFVKTSLNIWKFTVHILLKSDLKNFKYYFGKV